MNKQLYLLLLLFFVSCNSNTDWSKIEYNSNLYNPFFDENIWNYRWYIYKDDEGNFNSSMGDTITETDTAHLYNTAKIITNHQGEHDLKYCDARLNGDTLILSFPPSYPAYWLEFEVVIEGSKFKTIVKGVPFTADEFEYEVIKQQLTLLTNNYSIGDSIKGEIYIEFDEKGVYQDLILLDIEYNAIDSIKGDKFTKENQVYNNFYFSGAFKALIE